MSEGDKFHKVFVCVAELLSVLSGGVPNNADPGAAGGRTGGSTETPVCKISPKLLDEITRIWNSSSIHLPAGRVKTGTAI